jgi:hypothetical protein
MEIGTKVKIKWNNKIGEIVSIDSRREGSPNLIVFYSVKDDTGKIEEYTRREIRYPNE